MGGKALAATHDQSFFEKIGKLGGQANLDTKGRDYFSEIGKMANKPHDLTPQQLEILKSLLDISPEPRTLRFNTIFAASNNFYHQRLTAVTEPDKRRRLQSSLGGNFLQTARIGLSKLAAHITEPDLFPRVGSLWQWIKEQPEYKDKNPQELMAIALRKAPLG